MPWIDKERCTGCQICLEECVAEAISMRDNVAFIDDKECIRCGICHDACPNGAVRHDSEQIPLEVEANIQWVNQLLNHGFYANDQAKQRGLIKRMERFFVKNGKVAQQTIERLQAMGDSSLPEQGR